MTAWEASCVAVQRYYAEPSVANERGLIRAYGLFCDGMDLSEEERESNLEYLTRKLAIERRRRVA